MRLGCVAVRGVMPLLTPCALPARPDRFFTMNVDPTQLQAGAHYAEVRGYDADNTEGGPVFRIPITVRPTLDFARSPGAG